MTLNELNNIQLRAEEALYSLREAQRHLAFVPGFLGAKANVIKAITTAEYVVNEVNKLEVTDE